MIESREISKKKSLLKAIAALGFCFVAPFSAFAETANQSSNSLSHQVNDAKVKKSIVIGNDGVGRVNNAIEANLTPVDFPDSSFENEPNIEIGSLAPQGTRTYSRDEIYQLIATESRKIGVDPQFTYIIAEIESGFRQFVVSEKGAVGVMQLMPATAAELGVVNSYDAAQNIRGGVSYLKKLLAEFGNPLMAAAAYHSGPQAARDANGIPKGPRTAKYMVRILNDYYRIADSNFKPSSTTNVKSVSSVKKRPLKRQTTKAATSRVSAKPVQDGNPESWDAGFVLHLE